MARLWIVASNLLVFGVLNACPQTERRATKKESHLLSLQTTTPASQLIFTNNDRKLLALCEDGSLRLWNFKSGNPGQPPKHIARCPTIWCDITSDQEALTCIQKELFQDKRWRTPRWVHWLRVYRLRDGRLLTQHSIPDTGNQTRAALSPSGKILALTDYEGTGKHVIRLWEVKTGKIIRSFTGHPEAITALMFSPNGRYLASGSEGKVQLWDLTGRQPPRSLLQNGIVVAVGFSPN
jgi:WD40 repeat protein